MKFAIRNIAAAVGLGLGSLAVGLLFLELLLQLGAWYTRTTRQELPSLFSTDHQRVLCVGDSNTYGIWLPDRALAYPTRLEALWNESARTPQIEVLNLGYPNNNSSRLLKSLPDLLERLRPDRVIVMIGANDFRTEPVDVDPGQEGPGFWSTLRQKSRTYRLAYMYFRALGGDEVEISAEVVAPNGGIAEWTVQVGGEEFSLGYGTVARPERRRAAIGLMSNLDAIVRLGERYGADVTLMTYPSRDSLYAVSNPLIRTVATQTGTRLIDLARTFAETCPDVRCEKLLFRDQHPNKDGYALAAQTIVDQLAADRSP